VSAESVSGCYPALMAARRGSVRAFRASAAFHDIGTPADYLQACLQFAAGRPATLVAATARVDQRAVLDGSVVWEDVAIGPEVRLQQTIVMSGARVPAGFTASRQIVLPDLSLVPIV
jgi:NDP-sugar pyrophosphorylase family protein